MRQFEETKSKAMAFGWDNLATAAIPLIGGLFGSKKPKPSAAEQAQAQLAQEQADQARLMRGYGMTAENDYAVADRTAQRGIADYAALLGTDPYTDQVKAREIGNMTSGVNNAYLSGKANLSSDLAARGISDSSALTGGLTGIENARSGAISGALQNVNSEEDANRYSRAQQLAALLAGNAGKLREQGSE